MIFSLILAIVFAVIAVIFALGNTDPVTVSFLTWHLEDQPLALVLLVAVAIGILIGILLMTPGTIKRNLTLSGQKKKLKTVEKELDQHKTKMTELEGKVQKTVAEEAQVAAEVDKRLEETLK